MFTTLQAVFAFVFHRRSEGANGCSSELLWIAEHSPRRYALRIWIRNYLLLRKLRYLKPYVMKNAEAFVQLNSTLLQRVEARLSWGCPHCHGIRQCLILGPCLWQRCLPLSSAKCACMRIKFPSGSSLEDLVQLTREASHGIPLAEPIGWTIIKG